MMVARGPNFVEQETVGRLDGAVEVVGDAAVFATSGRDRTPRPDRESARRFRRSPRRDDLAGLGRNMLRPYACLATIFRWSGVRRSGCRNLGLCLGLERKCRGFRLDRLG